MLLIPAIDLKDGHCVRLIQGDMDQSTVFSEDPADMALQWVNKGARRLHLVDLNGAFAGKPQNFSAIRSILKAVGDDIPVQLGGGIRDLDTIEKYIDGGVRYIIIGTAAVKNPGFLQDACSAFGGHIIVGLDAKLGKQLWKDDLPNCLNTFSPPVLMHTDPRPSKTKVPSAKISAQSPGTDQRLPSKVRKVWADLVSSL